MSSALVYAIGFLAQGLFSARLAVQWIMSERAKRVLSPSIFWVISLFASVLLFIYGWLRHDFAIMLGQFLGYYIYIWNLHIKGLWVRLPQIFRLALILLPLVSIGSVVSENGEAVVAKLFRNDGIPLPLLALGVVGQVVFMLRFIYQWAYSRSKGESVLPIGFWVISLIGAALIVTYGIIRLDPVILLGQSMGFVVYIRNIMLYRKSQDKR